MNGDIKRRSVEIETAALASVHEAAGELGCSHIMTATGEAVEGDPQHSWGNIGRYGFKPSFRTRNFAVSSKG